MGNPDFPPGLELREFRKLREKGCLQASHLLISDNWPTIDLLVQQRGQFEIPFWQAQQVQHFMETLVPQRAIEGVVQNLRHIVGKGNFSTTLSLGCMYC